MSAIPRFNPEVHFYGNVCKRCRGDVRYIKSSKCVSCVASYDKRRYMAEDGGVRNSRMRAYYAGSPKARQKRRIDCKKYWNENKPRMKLTYQKWQRENREHVNLYNQRQRALRSGVESGPYSRSDIFSMYPRCLSCGSDQNLALDHVTPISKGGPNVAGNLQVLCKSCNSKKRATYHEYRPTYLLSPGDWCLTTD